jgi:large conductance mechanosensitive channel
LTELNRRAYNPRAATHLYGRLGMALKTWDEFKAFAFKGNMIDLAVGVIIGAAFGGVVTSLTKDVITPVISYVTPSMDFSEWHVGKVMVGNFLNALIAFLIQAFAVFIVVVKVVGYLTKKRAQAEPVAAAPPPLTKDQELLTEIRDTLRSKA